MPCVVILLHAMLFKCHGNIPRIAIPTKEELSPRLGVS